MFAQGDAVGVAVSGGRDSVCLLDVLHKLTEGWQLRLKVLHVNHRLRPEADAEEEFVRQLAAARDLEFVVDRPKIDDGNMEEAARTARLQFFHRLIESGSVRRVATGHTHSDQAETVLFRLLRGSGASGLRGILPVTRKGLVRPLIEVTREDVNEWVQTRGAEWHEDSSNSDRRFARNRIRHELLPQLARDWNPRIAETLARTAEISAAEHNFIEEATSALWTERATTEPDGSIVIDFQAPPPLALARRLIRRAIEAVKGDLRQIDFEHVESILQMTHSSNGHGRVIVPGVDVIRSFHWLRFAPFRVPSDEIRNWSFPLGIPAAMKLPDGNRVEIGFDEPGCAYNEIVSRLDLPAARKSLILRNWRPGDTFQLGDAGDSPKIKELFQSERIPLWERKNWPVIAADDRVIWAGEFGIVEGLRETEPQDEVFVKLTRARGLYRLSVNRNGTFRRL